MDYKSVDVSGCIVTYNNEDTIDKCIGSIIKNTEGVNFKLFVSDNGSQDCTLDIVKNNYPEVVILENSKNGGFGYGHNQVLPFLTSKYHFIINPDIFIDRDVLTEMVAYLESHDKAAMITPKILNIDGTEQFLPKRNPTFRFLVLSKFKPYKKYRKLYTRELEQLSKATNVDFCTGCFFGIRTELLKKMDGFDSRYFMYFEDADLSRQVRKKADIIFYPTTFVFHEWKRENTRKIKGVMRWGISMIKYFNKWGWKF